MENVANESHSLYCEPSLYNPVLKHVTYLLLFYENDENLIFGVKYVSVYIVYIKTQDNLTNNTMHGCCLPTLNIATFYVSLDSNTFMGIEHQKIFNKTIHLVLVS